MNPQAKAPPSGADACQYNVHPLGTKRCGKPATARIVRREDGRQESLRCKEHTPNMRNSSLFRTEPLLSSNGSAKR